MYEKFWGLQCSPFENRSDERFFFPSEAHQAAQLKLHYAIETRRSVAILCGESGLGKSMLLDSVIARLPDSIAPVVRVSYPAMPPDQLLRYIARQMAPQEAQDLVGGIGQSIETIERLLRHNAAENQHALMVIDEAQLLDANGALEPLRLLLNLAAENSGSESAMTIVLAGNSNLLAHVGRHASFEDRVAVRCVLERFSLMETASYIRHRLQVAGAERLDPFTIDAIDAIQEFTLGVPRRINRLCDLALMVGFAQDSKKMDASDIENAHRELSIKLQAA